MYSRSSRSVFMKILAGFVACLMVTTLLMFPMKAKAAEEHELPKVSTISDATLSFIGSPAVEVTDNATVYSTDKLMLRYKFNMDEEQTKSIIEQTSYGTGSYTVEVPAPDGLKWKKAFPEIMLTAKVSDEPDRTFGYLSVVEGPGEKLMATVRFTGTFWAGDLETLSNAYVELECELDMDAINPAQTYNLKLEAGKNINIKVGDNQLAEHEVIKAGKYNADTNHFEWKITYKPGTVKNELPFTLTDTFDNTTHVFVKDSLKWNEGGLPNTCVTDEGTVTTISYEITSLAGYTANAPMVFTYETAITDNALNAALPADGSATSVVATNNAVIRDDADALVGEDDANATAPSDSLKWMNKTGEPVGRKIKWTVTITTNDRKLENLVMHDKLPTGLTLDTDTILINGVSLATAGGVLSTAAADDTFNIALPKVAGVYLPHYTVVYYTSIDDSYFDNAELPAGQSFVADSVTIGGTPMPGIETVTDDPKTLTIRLCGAGDTISNTIVVTFQTKLDVDAIEEFKSKTAFDVPNRISLQRADYDDETASGSQSVSNQMLNKTGAHNANDNTLSYSVEINPNGINLTGLSLTDSLPAGLELDVNSVLLYSAKVNPAGKFSKEGATVHKPNGAGRWRRSRAAW